MFNSARIMTQPEVYTADAPYYYKSVRDAFKTIYHNEGIGTFYKGLGSSLLGVSHVAIQFPLYEKLKYWTADSMSTTNSVLIASALSKMVASTVTYPHEVVRTRLHTQVRKKGTTELKYTGIQQSARLIYGHEGLAGFYKGFGLNLVRTVPVAIVNLLTYEVLCKLLTSLNS
jgi:solute carrier family 25 (mitochondrial folate transporter), member 32